MTRKRKKLRGTVAKVVKPLISSQPEKAEIEIHEAIESQKFERNPCHPATKFK